MWTWVIIVLIVKDFGNVTGVYHKKKFIKGSLYTKVTHILEETLH